LIIKIRTVWTKKKA